MLSALKATREQGCGNEPCLDWERRKTFEKTTLGHDPKDEKRKPAVLWEGSARTHRLGCFDEHFAPPELELVAVHVDGLQQVEDTLLLVSSPRGPGGFGQDGIPVRIIGREGSGPDCTAPQRHLVWPSPGDPFTT